MKPEILVSIKIWRKSAFSGLDKPIMLFFLLIIVKMPTIVGILIFISSKNFMLSWAEHGKIFIPSGPDLVCWAQNYGNHYSQTNFKWLWPWKILMTLVLSVASETKTNSIKVNEYSFRWKNSTTCIRALGKRDFLMIIFLISHRNHIMWSPHLNHLDETVQMRGHNVCFYAELTKIIPNYHQIRHLISSFDVFPSLLPLFSKGINSLWANSFFQEWTKFEDIYLPEKFPYNSSSLFWHNFQTNGSETLDFLKQIIFLCHLIPCLICKTDRRHWG